MRAVSLGDRGPAVSDVQKRLFDLGYAPPGLDTEMREAYYGERTAHAVREFQRNRGLHVDGRVDENTWHELVEASYRLGDRFLYLRVPPFRGDDVRELQRYLNRLGFNAGREDGIFGRDTDRALRAFQHNMDLPVDGIAGSSTLSCLQRLRHALKDTSVAVVHEAIQDLSYRGMAGRTVVLDAGEGDARAEDAARLAAGGLKARGMAVVITGGFSSGLPEGARARLANDCGADIVIGLRACEGSGVRIFFFGSGDYSSPRGRRLAALLREELEKAGGSSAAPPEARSYPMLRETRMPCVILEYGFESDPLSVLPPAIVEAVTAYFGPEPA